MKGHFHTNVHAPPHLHSGMGTPALSLRREMPYTTGKYSFIVNYLFKHFFGSRLWGSSVPPWCFHCLQQLLSQYRTKESEECCGFSDSFGLLAGQAWSTWLCFGPLFHPSCSFWHGAVLPCCDSSVLTPKVPSQVSLLPRQCSLPRLFSLKDFR